MDLPEFHRLAEYELSEAAQYYELEEPGLGATFLVEVDRCLQAIQAAPDGGAILRGEVRRRLLRRFPYALLYYRAGVVPLVVPVTLIRHHVRRLGIAYLAGQTDLNPHPKELMLRNHV